MNERDNELDYTNDKVVEEDLDFEKMSENPELTEGRHEVIVEKGKKIRRIGYVDKEYDVKKYDFTTYRVWFRLVQDGVKSEVFYADTLNRALISGMCKLFKAQGVRACEMELSSTTYDRVSQRGKQYEARKWTIEAVFPIDEMSIDKLKEVF